MKIFLKPEMSAECNRNCKIYNLWNIKAYFLRAHSRRESSAMFCILDIWGMWVSFLFSPLNEHQSSSIIGLAMHDDRRQSKRHTLVNNHIGSTQPPVRCCNWTGKHALCSDMKRDSLSILSGRVESPTHFFKNYIVAKKSTCFGIL